MAWDLCQTQHFPLPAMTAKQKNLPLFVLPQVGEQPRGALWPSVPSHANVHGWRADYAARCYQYALDNGKGSGDVYHAKNNNTTWDKGALDFVSENLGHGEGRYYTVVYNYLSYGKN